MPLICPYCRGSIEENEAYNCPACGTPHHADCFAENRGCTVFGCEEAPPDEEKISIGAIPPAAPGRASMYHVTSQGQEIGPYTLDEIRQMVSDGHLAVTEYAWSQGMQNWVPITQLIGAAASPPPPPLPAAGRPQALTTHPAYPVYNQPIYGQPQGLGQQVYVQAPPRPPTYLLSAILVTLFCCLPFGIVSIVFASQVDSKYNSGDYAGAQAASNTAKNWYHAALISGIIIAVLWIIGRAANQQ